MALQDEIDMLLSPEGQKTLKREQVAPTIRVIERLVHYAITQNTSDIHIEPQAEHLIVRFRIDGVLNEVLRITDDEVRQSLVSSIKARASMFGDASGKRKPQDGRWSLTSGGEHVDLRLSTVPVVNGEKLVMRIFRGTVAKYSLDSIGLNETQKETLKNFLHNKMGMVFVTGPTGSGKTTTLYSALNYLNTPDMNIVTLEDPVEFKLDRINQSQIEPVIGFNFSDGLRALLRQDPDVVFLGEIRDKDTAEIAIRASLTGHLVLTTVHTNDAVTAITRLIDMGIEPFLIAATPALIINQRLVRSLCPECRVPAPLPALLPGVLEKLRTMKGDWYRAGGCAACSSIGYKGRVPVFEMLKVTDEIRKLILQNADASQLEKAARASGMQTFTEDAMRLIAAGITSVDEVMKLVIL